MSGYSLPCTSTRSTLAVLSSLKTHIPTRIPCFTVPHTITLRPQYHFVLTSHLHVKMLKSDVGCFSFSLSHMEDTSHLACNCIDKCTWLANPWPPISTSPLCNAFPDHYSIIESNHHGETQSLLPFHSSLRLCLLHSC